ncbi:MAG TPA: ATP-binding protein [Gallionellaceae bacterium]|nr:ATP-binding protein [Gallionellaceae bacterium]
MQQPQVLEYEREIRAHRLSFSIACAYIAIVLILAGMGLDYGLYPERQFLFGSVRVFASVLIYVIILALKTQWGRDRAEPLALLWLLVPQVMITWMISETQGALSMYSIGLYLAIFASGIGLPYNFWYNVALSVITFCLYIAACSVHPESFLLRGPFVVNSLILLFVISVSLLSAFFNERTRFMLYRLRAEVGEKNAQLEKTNKDLAEIKGQMLQQEKMAAIGTLSSGLLHEVNNPVNYCLMAINLAIDHPTAKSDATLQEYLGDAREGMQRIQRIVSDLKTFAYRPRDADSAGSDFPLSRALDTALRMVGHETRDISITRQLPEDVMVHGDEGAIVGVLINLLGNAATALQSVPRREAKIAVSATWAGERLRVTVADNGPGISGENLARVFEPFFTTREIGQGLGLGLSISYSVIERHGGALLAESEPGAGTRMIFDLPRAGR